MSKTRRNKNQFPDKEGKKGGSRPMSDDSEKDWDEEEEEEEEEDEEDEDDEEWEPEWPDEDDEELRASDWGDDPLMDL